MRTVIDKTYLRLVNKEHPLDSHKPNYYEYDDVLVKTSNDSVVDTDDVVEVGAKSSVVRTFIEKRTNRAFEDLKADLAKKGMNIRINEAGRTADKQQFYRERAEKLESELSSTDKSYENYADNYVARPNETEHGLGTAVDIGTFSKAVSRIKNPKINNAVHKIVRKLVLYPVMHKTAIKHGFITRYPIKYTISNKRRQEIEDARNSNNVLISSSGDEFRKLLVQYNYEPWHLTYVGEENARFIADNKITLEEYVRLVEIYEEYADELNNDANCPSLQEFYDLYTLQQDDDDKSL